MKRISFCGSLRGLSTIVLVTASYIIAIPVFAHESCNVHYKSKEIGAPGNRFLFASAINERGHIVGNMGTRAGDTHGFIWSRERGLKDLGTLGGTRTDALDVNDRDEVVGYSETKSGERHGFLWTWRHGMRDLDLPFVDSFAEGINNRGQVAGSGASTSSSPGLAYLWSPRQPLQHLGTLGGDASIATAINERAHVVGSSRTASGTDMHAYLWTKTRGMEDLGTLGGTRRTDAFDVNDRDEVVGEGIDDQFNSYAFFWTRQQGMQDLGNLGTSACGSVASAQAVNIQGRVVGYSGTLDCFTHAFVWSRKCGMQDLNDLVDTGSGISLVFAQGITARGQIVANGTDAEGVSRVYLLTPESEEAVSALP